VKRIPEIAMGLAKTAGAPDPIITQVDAIPSVVNDQGLTDRFRGGVTKVLGPELVASADRIMPSEDFSLYGPMLGCKALRWFIGAADPTGTISNHSPHFAPQMKTLLPLGVKATVAGLMELHAPQAAGTHSGQ
jgi:hippurate hydrolase